MFDEIGIGMDIGQLIGTEEESSPQQLVLYIPNKDKSGNEIENLSYWIKEAQRVLTAIGRGCTAMPPADGTWLDPEKFPDKGVCVWKVYPPYALNDEDILWEKTTIIYTYIEADRFEKYIGILRKFLHRFGRETNQGEVVFELAGKFRRIRNYDME